jgi:hypothetical protein
MHELLASEVSIQDGVVFVVDVDVEFLDFGKDVAIDKNQILPTVEIEIEEAGPQPT